LIVESDFEDSKSNLFQILFFLGNICALPDSRRQKPSPLFGVFLNGVTKSAQHTLLLGGARWRSPPRKTTETCRRWERINNATGALFGATRGMHLGDTRGAHTNPTKSIATDTMGTRRRLYHRYLPNLKSQPTIVILLTLGIVNNGWLETLEQN
jgi:hypothetical protein